MTPAAAGWPAGAAVVTAAWVAVALAGGDGSPVATDALGAAAAAGAAALVGAGWRPRTVPTIEAAGAMLVVLPLAVAAARGSALPLAVVLAVVGLAEQAHPAGSGWRGAVLVAGAVLLGVAVVVGHGETARWGLPYRGDVAAALALAAAATLLVGAALAPPRSRALVVPALLVGLTAVPSLPGLPVALAAGALALVWALAVPTRPGPALGLLALAAASAPASRPAAALLAAGSALALVVDHPGMAALGLPGAAALAAAALAGASTSPPAAAAVAAVLTGFVLVARSPLGVEPPAPVAGALPAAVLAVWLLVAPGTWGWTGGTGIGPYDRGAATAVAAGALGVLAARVAELRRRAA